jgi:hypothetical protein
MNDLGSPLQVFALTGVASIPGERLSKTSDKKFGRSSQTYLKFPINAVARYYKQDHSDEIREFVLR